MRAFGSLRIAAIIAILFLSFAECMPNKELNKEDYLDDGEYDEDLTIGNEDDDTAQPADSGPIGPVQVISHNMELTVRPGDTVEFPCLVENGEDTVINWLRGSHMFFFNDQQLSEDDSRFSRAKNFSLILRNATENDTADNYRCQILVNPMIEVVHTLHVVDKPRELLNVIQVKPARRVEVNENESITFGCETSMEPKPEMKWSFKGKRVQSNEEIESNGNFITIKKATRHHAGRYQCLAENDITKPAHDAIEVVVRYKPEIEVEHEIVHTGTGMKSQLTCTVHAHPHAKVTWHKNQKMVTEKSGRRSFIDEKSRRSLVIEHTTQHDLGHYTCTAKNQLGETSRTIELTGAPSQPRFHSGEIANDESTLILKWHVESFAPITEYKLEYRREGETAWTTLSPRVTNGRGNQFTAEHPLGSLQPGSYEAKLMARNEYGWSQHSNPHTFREEYKSADAENVKGSAITCRPLLALTAVLALVVSSYDSIGL